MKVIIDEHPNEEPTGDPFGESAVGHTPAMAEAVIGQ
jgi:hypothetical protein